MQAGQQKPTQSATFIGCTFRIMIGSGINGGAIYFADKSNGILTITQCLFDHCEVSVSKGDGTGGGGIYAKSVSNVDISDSSFIHCMCNTTNNSDGGAIELNIITIQPKISECTFIFCHADDDGGAVSIRSSNAANPIVCNDCRYTHCSVSHIMNLGPGGGGMILWENNNFMRCTNILFSDNEGTYGGAYANNKITQSPNCLLSFCFFNKNTGTYGNDLYFPSLPSQCPCMHCLSTSDSYRVSYQSSSSYLFSFHLILHSLIV